MTHLQMNGGSNFTPLEVRKKLIAAGFQLSQKGEGYADYEHPDFDGRVTLNAYNEFGKYNSIYIFFWNLKK